MGYASRMMTWLSNRNNPLIETPGQMGHDPVLGHGIGALACRTQNARQTHERKSVDPLSKSSCNLGGRERDGGYTRSIIAPMAPHNRLAHVVVWVIRTCLPIKRQLQYRVTEGRIENLGPTFLFPCSMGTLDPSRV